MFGVSLFIATCWIYRGCLTENLETLSVGLNNASSVICYTTGEGFQHDGSFFQHGSQIYIGGYGEEIIKSATQFALTVRNTSLALSADKVAVLSYFVRNTYYAVICGNYMAFSVMGRSVSRPGVLDKSKSFEYAERMQKIDPMHHEEYEDIIARIKKGDASYHVQPSDKHYFRADYTLHTRKLIRLMYECRQNIHVGVKVEIKKI